MEHRKILTESGSTVGPDDSPGLDGVRAEGCGWGRPAWELRLSRT